jgi:hypothetical protein
MVISTLAEYSEGDWAMATPEMANSRAMAARSAAGVKILARPGLTGWMALFASL